MKISPAASVQSRRAAVAAEAGLGRDQVVPSIGEGIYISEGAAGVRKRCVIGEKGAMPSGAGRPRISGRGAPSLTRGCTCTAACARGCAAPSARTWCTSGRAGRTRAAKSNKTRSGSTAGSTFATSESSCRPSSPCPPPRRRWCPRRYTWSCRGRWRRRPPGRCCSRAWGASCGRGGGGG